MNFDARPSSDFIESEFQPLASKWPPQGKNHRGGRAKVRNLKPSLFCRSVSWLPEKHLRTEMRCESNECGGFVFGFECCRVGEHVWVDTGPTAHCGTIIEMSVCDPDTQEVIPWSTQPAW